MPSGVYVRTPKILASVSEHNRSVKKRESQSNIMKSRWKDPKYSALKSLEWKGEKGILRKEKIRNAMKLILNTPEVKAKLGKQWRGKKQTEEHRRKVLARRTPSSLEIRVVQLIEKYQLPYQFVGNGTLWISDHNPDFVRIDSRKQVVEVYATFQKIRNFGNVDNYRFQREFQYKQFGYETVFLSEEDILSVDWETRCLAKLV